MLKLKLQHFGHLMQRVDSLEKTLMLGGTGGRRRGDDRWWDGWMASLTRWSWVWVDSGILWWTGRPGVLQFTGSQSVRHDWATELTDWLKSLLWTTLFFPPMHRPHDVCKWQIPLPVWRNHTGPEVIWICAARSTKTLSAWGKTEHSCAGESKPHGTFQSPLGVPGLHILW